MKIEAFKTQAVIEDVSAIFAGVSVIPAEFKKHIDNLANFSAYAN